MEYCMYPGLLRVDKIRILMDGTAGVNPWTMIWLIPVRMSEYRTGKEVLRLAAELVAARAGSVNDAGAADCGGCGTVELFPPRFFFGGFTNCFSTPGAIASVY